MNTKKQIAIENLYIDFYIDFDSCVIERVKVPTFDSEKKFVPMVRLTDEEGGHLFNFPDSFTDEQIKVAVAFANQSYRLGKIHGISLYKS